jgi:VWFA-related protein
MDGTASGPKHLFAEIFQMRLASTLLFMPLALAPMVAQSAPAPPTPTLQVYSRETIVDVTVTDAKGNPVHGLKQSDFTVKEDGKPQAIRSFEEHGETTTATQSLPKLPPNVYTNLQPSPASGALNILLLDFVNAAPVLGADCCEITPCPFPKQASADGPSSEQCSDPGAGPAEVARAVAAQHRVKLAAINYLQHMPVGTRVEVVGMWWPSTLRVLQGFTSDPALLSAAVDTMPFDTDSRVAAGSPDPSPRRGGLKQIDSASSDATDALVGNGTLYEQICSEADGRARMTLEVLQQVAGDFIGVKGKKNLIWFTIGTPYITEPDSRPACLPDYSIGLTRAYSLLMAAQVALYPIDARGLMTMPDDLLELSGKLMLKVFSLPGNLHADAVSQFAMKTTAEQMSMESWAERTGGAAFYNTNDLGGALTQAIDKGSNYYTLSYVPPGTKFDGRHHAIKVTADQPGLHLVYRDGYEAEDPSTFKPAQGLTLANAREPEQPGPVDMRREMARSMPTSQQLVFHVQIEPSSIPAQPGDPAVFGMLDVKLKDKRLTRYGFSYSIPGDQIALQAADGKRHGSLEFDLAAYDSDGNVVTSWRQAIGLNLTEQDTAQFASSPFRYVQQLDLPSGQLFLRVGVLDRTANKVGTLEIPLTVPKK